MEEINQMKKKLERLMKTHDLNDALVLEASCQLDNLILEYYSEEYNDIKIKRYCKVPGKRVNKKGFTSIRSMT